MSHRIMGKAKNGLTNVFYIRDDESVFDKPETIVLLNEVHAHRCACEFVNKWVHSISTFDGIEDFSVELEFWDCHAIFCGIKN